MEKQTDLRIVRTKQMLKDAFFGLMETDGFGKITVENLTKKAFISRNTFYLHYTDKYDLLDHLENEVLDEIREIMRELPGEIINSQSGLAMEAKPIIMKFFQYIRDNQRFFNLIVAKNGDSAFLGKLGDMIRGMLHSSFPQAMLRIPERYMVAIIVGVQTGIIREWISGGMNETPDELAAMLTMVIRNVPKNVLAR